ncbi:MAG TPA: hypothetical protein VFP10_04590, partial [Candidatus Eisenbacteria bacterium]|nr:hypothetical protein [Candidatus Eisenbacteria bacterium]
GGVVEISVNGGDWQLAFPEDGYSTYYGGIHPEWKDRPMFAGRPHGGQFHRERIDLSAYSGSLRVRFRFYSEDGIRVGEGWHIDNVIIERDVTPVRVLSAQATVIGEGVRLDWELAEPFPAQVRWVRGTRAEAPTWSSSWLPAGAEGTVVDSLGALALPAQYWLVGLERDGTTSRWGPYHVTATSPPPRVSWRLLGNPVRGAARFSLEGSLPVGARLEIFDVNGRRVYGGPAESDGHTLIWNGRDGSGMRVSAGIYLARLAPSSAPTLRLVVLP